MITKLTTFIIAYLRGGFIEQIIVNSTHKLCLKICAIAYRNYSIICMLLATLFDYFFLISPPLCEGYCQAGTFKEDLLLESVGM